jgi:hypothetical protein
MENSETPAVFVNDARTGVVEGVAKLATEAEYVTHVSRTVLVSWIQFY